MTWSLNETEALCRKAARGAGMPWGLAEEAGRAARWLEDRGQAGAGALAKLLGRWNAGMTPRDCPVLAGAAMADAGVMPASPVTADPLTWPFVAMIAGLTGEALSPTEGVKINPDGSLVLSSAMQHLRGRAAPDAAAIATLESFAARTYAPATEASRLAGAGAGTSDND